MEKARQYSAVRGLAAGLALALMAGPVAAQDVTRTALPVPSGQTVYWQGTTQDIRGQRGLTARYRFYAPDLAQMAPATNGPVGEFITPEDEAEMDLLGRNGATATPDMTGMAGMALMGDPLAERIDPADILVPQVTLVPGTEPLADMPVTAAIMPPPVDAAQDPVFADMLWLCTNYVLPRIASPAPRPREIVIALSDRPGMGRDFDPDRLQVYEAFALPADADLCLWEPL